MHTVNEFRDIDIVDELSAFLTEIVTDSLLDAIAAAIQPVIDQRYGMTQRMSQAIPHDASEQRFPISVVRQRELFHRIRKSKIAIDGDRLCVKTIIGIP